MATVPVNVHVQGAQHQGFLVHHHRPEHGTDYKIAVTTMHPCRRNQTVLCIYDRAALVWRVAPYEATTAKLTASAVTPAQLETARASFHGALEFASTNISFPSAGPRCPTGPTFNFRVPNLYRDHGPLAVRITSQAQVNCPSGFLIARNPDHETTLHGHVTRATSNPGALYSCFKVLDETNLPATAQVQRKRATVRSTQEAIFEYLRNPNAAYPCELVVFDLRDVRGTIYDWGHFSNSGNTARNLSESKVELIIDGVVPHKAILHRVTLNAAPPTAAAARGLIANYLPGGAAVVPPVEPADFLVGTTLLN